MNAHVDAPTSVVDLVLQQLKQRLGSAQSAQAQGFATHFFRRVSADDLAARPVEDWVALLISLLEFVRVRKPGVPAVRVFNPTHEHDGWDSGHTVVDIVTEDMPFLVDSVGIAIAQAQLLVYSAVHPVYSVERDPGGHILALSAEGVGKGGIESLMHFEVDRVGEPAERVRLEQSVRAALADVAAC
ncbi:MAG: NAD-glutamate dehydrogenase, partial [Rudaea sp.]